MRSGFHLIFAFSAMTLAIQGAALTPLLAQSKFKLPAPPPPPLAAADSPTILLLETMQGNYRPLLVFAPTDKNAAFLKQVQLFAESGYELGQRKVILVSLSKKAEAKSWGVVFSPLQAGVMPADAADDVRQRFNVTTAKFTVILLDKNGNEMLRSHQPITAQTLLQTIDSTAIGQQEIRQRAAANVAGSGVSLQRRSTANAGEPKSP